jgi:hypothetical protein
MAGAFFYFTMLLASFSLLPNSAVSGVQGVNAQYLLGLGKLEDIMKGQASSANFAMTALGIGDITG